MKKNIENIKDIISEKKDILERKYKIIKIGFFGSYVRGDETDESDIDIIVELSESLGLEFVHLNDYLSEILDLKVDLVTLDSIKSNRIPYITKDIMYV